MDLGKNIKNYHMGLQLSRISLREITRYRWRLMLLRIEKNYKHHKFPIRKMVK